MIQKPFDAINKADIDALIAKSVGESKTLEYKQELPGPKDDDKKEFLADVSSFANASGGDIIYGIKAAVNAEGKKTGDPEAVTEQGQRSAQVTPKPPLMVERTPQTRHGARQKVGLRNEDVGPAGFGTVMLRRMVGDGRRPKANREIPVIKNRRKCVLLHSCSRDAH